MYIGIFVDSDCTRNIPLIHDLLVSCISFVYWPGDLFCFIGMAHLIVCVIQHDVLCMRVAS